LIEHGLTSAATQYRLYANGRPKSHLLMSYRNKQSRFNQNTGSSSS